MNLRGLPSTGEASPPGLTTVRRMRRLVLACSILALCVPALALADGGHHAKTLTGTLTANPSGSITVASKSATLTCTVPGQAITSVAKLKLGAHLMIACQAHGKDGLVLTGIKPLGSRGDKHDSGQTGTTGTTTGTTTTTHTGDGDHGTTTTTTTPHTGDGDHGTTTTTTTTHAGDGDHGTTTTTAPPPPPPPTQQHREAIGIVFFLSSTGIAVRPDKGGDVLTCAVTTAPDSAAAFAKLTLNGHFGIVCRLDGTRWVLSGATPAP